MLKIKFKIEQKTKVTGDWKKIKRNYLVRFGYFSCSICFLVSYIIWREYRHPLILEIL